MTSDMQSDPVPLTAVAVTFWPGEQTKYSLSIAGKSTLAASPIEMFAATVATSRIL